MADIYFYQGDTDEDEGGYSDSSITTPSQVTKSVMKVVTSKSRSSTSREKKVLSPIFHCEIFICSHRHLQNICLVFSHLNSGYI